MIEEKLVIAGQIDQGSLVTQWQLSPSVRFTDYERGDDYVNEYFDRRDLTGPQRLSISVCWQLKSMTITPSTTLVSTRTSA